MSNCIEGLYDYNLVKNCSKCGNTLLKSNFHKNNKRKDGLYNQYKICRKEYYIENSIKLIEKQKDYYSENRDRVKDYQKKIILKIWLVKRFIVIINIKQISIFA